MVTEKYGAWGTEFYGLSTDTKPTNLKSVSSTQVEVPNGSVFYEMDTKKLYMYDADNNLWRQQ